MDYSTKTFNKTDEELISKGRKKECRYFIREEITGKGSMCT